MANKQALALRTSVTAVTLLVELRELYRKCLLGCALDVFLVTYLLTYLMLV